MAMNREEFARYQRGMHGPSWRAQAASNREIRPGTQLAEVADDLLVDFSKYSRIKGRNSGGIERAAVHYPIIAAADKLNEDQEKTAALKLMVVADMPSEEMQTRSGTKTSILQAWENLFFDARNQRQATAWLCRHVIEPEVSAGNNEFASKLKVAIMTGPITVRGMLDMQEGVCLDEADRLFQRRIKLNQKFDVAVNMPTDSEQLQMFFMKLHVSLMAAEKRQTMAEQRLAQRCVEARDRFELAKMRLEKAAELRAAKLNEKMRNSERRRNSAASRRRAAQELDGYRAQALRRTIQARVAESPLSLLRWKSERVAAFQYGSRDASVEADIVNIRGYQAMLEVIDDMNQIDESPTVNEPKVARLLAI